MDKRDHLIKDFVDIDTEIFRTDRHKREEKKRRKKALTRFDRHIMVLELKKGNYDED